MTTNHNPSPDTQVIWGAKNIAPFLGRSEKGAFQILESGKIPGARKVGGRWALDLRVFRASFESVAA